MTSEVTRQEYAGLQTIVQLEGKLRKLTPPNSISSAERQVGERGIQIFMDTTTFTEDHIRAVESLPPKVEERLMWLLKEVAPQYFQDQTGMEHRYYGTKRPHSEGALSVAGILFDTVTHHANGIDSHFRVAAVKEPFDDQDDAYKAISSPRHKKSITWSDLTENEIPDDLVKSIVIQHWLAPNDVKGYKHLLPDRSPCAYMDILTSLVTGKSVEEVREQYKGLSRPIEYHNSPNGTVLSCSTYDPTVERAESGSQEFLKFLQYVQENHVEIQVLAAQLDGIIKAEMSYKAQKTELKKQGHDHDRVDAQNLVCVPELVQIVQANLDALPKLECNLKHYI